MIVLKESEPELSYILALHILNSSICLKESCFPDYWKVSSVVLVFPVFKNVRRDLWRKTIALIVFVMWFVNSLKNLSIIDLLITLRIVAFLSDFQYVSGLLDQL